MNRKSNAIRMKRAENPNTYVSRLIMEFKDQQRAEIQKWRRALRTATDPETQRLYPLQDMFDMLKADGHYIGDVRLRKAATLCTPFAVVDKKTGDMLEEQTKLFQTKWFYDFMRAALDSVFVGYTLIEMTDTLRPAFKVLPRRNLVPSVSQVLFSVSDSKGEDYTPALGHTLVEVGEPEDLGVMADLCGLLIWKRNAQQSWAEYSEKFGFPLVTATTSKSSDAEIARVQRMLRTLGEAAQAVLPQGTTIDIKQSSTGDAFQVYDKQIERINTEISKALLGGTMLTDNGSSRSQSEVHERNLDEKLAEDDRRMITFTVNDQVIPMLALWGHPLDPERHEFRFEPADELSLKEYWSIINQMLDKYDIPDEWVSKKFGVPINGRRERVPLALPMASAGKGFSANFQ